MRAITLGVLFVLGACSSSSQPPAPSSGSAAPAGTAQIPSQPPPDPGTVPAPGTAPDPSPSSAPAPGSAVPPDACALACAHRVACLAPGSDVAACTADCRSVQGVFTPADLESYPRLSCDQVKEVEPAFRAAVSCRRLCTQRASCVPGADDIDACADTCSTLGQRASELEARYTSGDCTVAAELEPAFDRTRACVAACRHARECDVPDDVQLCLEECTTGLEAGRIDRAVLAELTAADCETLKERLARPAAPAPRPAAAPGLRGGGTMADCRRIGGSVVGGVCRETFACRKRGCPVGWTCGIEGFCHNNEYPNCLRCP